MNCICSLQLSEDIPMKTLHHLFNDNLEMAEMLTYVHGFNLSNSDMELDYILGQKDKDQLAGFSIQFKKLAVENCTV